MAKLLCSCGEYLFFDRYDHAGSLATLGRHDHGAPPHDTAYDPTESPPPTAHLVVKRRGWSGLIQGVDHATEPRGLSPSSSRRAALERFSSAVVAALRPELKCPAADVVLGGIEDAADLRYHWLGLGGIEDAADLPKPPPLSENKRFRMLVNERLPAHLLGAEFAAVRRDGDFTYVTIVGCDLPLMFHKLELERAGVGKE